MQNIEAIIQCGMTYQPLTIAISLISQTYTLSRVHILTTHSAMHGIEKIMDEFFGNLNYAVYGDFVDANGSEYDQSEYISNIEMILKNIKYQPIAVVASGTNWMTHHFSKKMIDMPIYVVKTMPAFEEKSFFPQNEPLAIGECGTIVQNDGKTPVCYLQKLIFENKPNRFFVEGRVVHFLGHQVELTLQEAAMFAFLASVGGVIDLEDDYTLEFNSFCESNSYYDNNRVFVDEFTGRFRQTVSKINSKLDECTPIVKKHLTIERRGNKYEINPMVLA
ncbi:MAG: hypothetical protein PHE67_01250 [Campylobacterales bacterium]|nr:hypothetical protein [Campylobacterales bacterium]